MPKKQEELVTPGDVIIEKAELETITGEKLNIIDLVAEINIYEDLFSNGTTGDVFIADSNNLFNLGPIIGQELFRIKFKTPVVDKDPIRELTFQVYKISKRVMKNDKTQGYMLHFSSLSTIRNSLTKIGRALSGQISNIVPNIIQDDLQSDLGMLTGTSGSYEYVIPYWTPFKTLNWLAKQATTADGNNINFVFFETINQGLKDTENGMESHFVSVGDLFKLATRHHQRYYFGPVQRTKRETGKEFYTDINNVYYTINDYEILESMDNLDAIRGGMFASRLISYDMTTKQIKNTSFNYLEDFKKNHHIGNKGGSDISHPLTVDRNNPGGFKYHDFPDSHIKRIDTQFLYHDNAIPQAPELKALKRQSALKQLGMFRMRCVVPGNSFLRAGDVFDIFLPSPEMSKSKPIQDRFSSGKYIITSLRHKIQKGNYFTQMELAKDSFFEAIPDTKKNSR